MVVLLVLLLLYSTSAQFRGWVDIDTPPEYRTIQSFIDGTEFEIVMSDEFNRDGRSFKDGNDPMWTAIDKSDDDQTSQGRKSLQFYNETMVRTENGHLVITTNTETTSWKGWNPYLKKYQTMTRHFKSGMVQTWNKFCFTGGIIEFDFKLPGSPHIGGLWPALWLMGNLGRATFEESTNLMWPWSFATCNRELQQAQEISGCDVTTHYELKPGMGRGATEIDILEVMSGPSSPLPFVSKNVRRPYNSMTLQLAPGVPANKRPQPGTLPNWGFTWYSNISYGNNVSINPFFYGTYLGQTKAQEPIGRTASESYQCDALSALMSIDESYYNSTKKIRLEWKTGPDGYLNWYIDNEFRYGINQSGLDQFGTQIPTEPSYIIMNTAISTSWGFPNMPYGCSIYDCSNPLGQCGFNPGFCQMLPAKFYIDNVRVYQNKNDPRQTIGCNPREYPTRDFIEAHSYRYMGNGQSVPILPITSGGAVCSKENKNCGQGRCDTWGYCKCDINWTGPRCMVLDYKDPFPDWDSGRGMFPLSLPDIPHLLIIAASVTILVVGAVAYKITRQQLQENNRVKYIESSLEKCNLLHNSGADVEMMYH